MLPTEAGRKYFKDKEEKGLAMIEEAIPEAIEVGLFGSYARDQHTLLSDIDFYVVTPTKLDRHRISELRCNMDEENMDVFFMSKEYYDTSEDIIVKNIKRDRRILHV